MTANVQYQKELSCLADLCSLSQSLHLLLDGPGRNPLPRAGRHRIYT